MKNISLKITGIGLLSILLLASVSCQKATPTGFNSASTGTSSALPSDGDSLNDPFADTNSIDPSSNILDGTDPFFDPFDPFATNPNTSTPIIISTTPSGSTITVPASVDPTVTTSTTPGSTATIQDGGGELSGTTSQPIIDTLSLSGSTGISGFNVSVPGQASQRCNQSCTMQVARGSTVTIQPITSAPLISELNRVAEVSHSRWGGSCSATAGGQNCTLTINGSTSATAFARETVEFRFAIATTSDSQERIQTALRNSSFLYDNGLWTKSGWANEGCWQQDGRRDCAGTGITSDATSINQFCRTVHTAYRPVGAPTIATANWGGWAYSGRHPQGYYNLRVARYTGSSWSNLCTDGRDCYDKQSRYVSRMTCGRDL